MTFDPKKTKTSRELSNMTGKELFERYFVEDNGTTWSADFRRERCRVEENQVMYPRINSLQGVPLQAIVTEINLSAAGIAPLGYKLNGPALVRDLEAILTENVKETTEAVKEKFNKNVTKFILDLSSF